MVQIVGKYVHLRSENLDDFFKAVGVPYIARKMMAMSNPSIEIASSESGEWSITSISIMRTVTHKFKLGEEYEERMPNAVIKSTTIQEGDKLVTKCVSPDNTHIIRTYEFSDEGMVITLKHEESGKEARRTFKRL